MVITVSSHTGFPDVLFSSVRGIRLCLPVDRGRGSLLGMVLVLGRGGR